MPTSPACSEVRPPRFMSGMVKVPVVTTLGMDEPEIRAVMAEPTAAALRACLATLVSDPFDRLACRARAEAQSREVFESRIRAFVERARADAVRDQLHDLGVELMDSPDGTTWTLRTSTADNGWQSVTYGNGRFVAVATTAA